MRYLTACVLALTGGLACADPMQPDPDLQPMSTEARDVVLPSSGPPFYTIAANGPWIPNDGEWAIFPFLRELSCVPLDADLFAITGGGGCPATVEGHEHWENGPGIDLAPRQTVFRGLGAVSIVFAALGEVQAAAGDGMLEMGELLALPSLLVGTATRYHETDIIGVSGPHGPGRGMYKITASGTLSDGRAFRFHLNEVLGQQRVVQVRFEAP